MNFVEINVTFWNLGETILKRASQHRGLSLSFFCLFSLHGMAAGLSCTFFWKQVPNLWVQGKAQIYANLGYLPQKGLHLEPTPKLNTLSVCLRF